MNLNLPDSRLMAYVSLILLFGGFVTFDPSHINPSFLDRKVGRKIRDLGRKGFDFIILGVLREREIG